VESVSGTVAPGQNSATIAWVLSDDWMTGSMDQWSELQNNRVHIDWSNDGGTTWNAVDEVFESQSITAVSSYDTSLGHAIWSDQYVWQTSQLPSGTYQVRVT